MPGRADLSKPFKCPKCPKKFTKRYIRDTHVIEKHENAGRFKCDGCDRSFQSEYNFEVHKKTHTGEKPFVCTVCQKSFASDETRRNHVLTMHENAGRFRCSYADCPKTFQIKHVLELHERTHMEEKELFECPVCQKGFTREDIRDNHVIVVHENAGRFKCSSCPRTFQVKGQWEKHERTHMDEKPFRCELCQMSFKSEDSVRLHHRNKHGEKKFACEQCGKRFGTKSGLNEHLLTHEEKTFQCELCPKVFNNERLLASHHRFYHEKAFGCEYCGKKFGSNSALKLHLAIHSGETPFQCELCPDKKFARKDYLRDHNRACHAKAWKCKICGKGFGKKWALENHQSVHSDEKPFQCPECPKSFAGKWSLYQHTQDWHSEKKFTCEHCGKGFRRPRPYKEHLLSHSDERVSCELCGKSLRPLSLRFHMKAVHSVKAPPRLVLGENQKENPKDQDENSNENQKEDQNEKPKEQLKEHQKEQPKKQPKEQPKKQPKKPRVKVEQPEGNDSGSATYSLRVRRNAPNYRAGQDDDESEQSEATEQSEESGSEFQESDDDETEVDEESGGEDELSEIDVENGGEDEPSEIDVENVEEDEVVGSDGMPSEEQDYDNVDEMPAKRMKTEHWVDDGDVQAFDDPTSGSQQTTTDQTIKREPGSDDGQTENNQGVNNQADLSEEPKDSKFVPIQSEATAFDCYDFNDLIKNNHSRMKAESDSQSPMVVQADHDVELPQESNADSSANLKVIYDVEYQAPQ